MAGATLQASTTLTKVFFPVVLTGRWAGPFLVGSYLDLVLVRPTSQRRRWGGALDFLLVTRRRTYVRWWESVYQLIRFDLRKSTQNPVGRAPAPAALLDV